MVIYRLYDGHRDVDMQECRNWQTSKTKDLVINAIVWVQVPSPALLFQMDRVHSEHMRLLKSEYICEMQECRNWQTSKTKDLVINAIVWVQVPSPACQAFTGSCKCLFIISQEEAASGVFLADMPNTPCLSQGSLDLQLVFVRVEKAPGTGKA